MAYYKCSQIFVTANSNVGVITTSPAPITNFTTDLALPLKSLKVEIKPKQASGTPTPSNPLPISGTDTVIVTQTGKNLVSGVISGGSIGSNGVIAGGSAQYDMAYAPIKSGVTYTISTNETTNQFVGGYFTSLPSVGSTSYDGQRVVQYSKTFTAPITGYVVFRQMSGYEYAQLEVGNQATTYEAYSATTKTVSLPSTVYGGEVDSINGNVKITYEKIYLKDLSFSYNTTSNVAPYFYASIAGVKREGNFNTTAYSAKSNFFPCVKRNPTDFIDKTFTFDGTPSAVAQIQIKDLDYTDPVLFQSSIENAYIIYPLATPEEITLANPIELTAQAGVNNVFGDTDGNISASYLKILSS